jgi:hypothetical protein
MERKTYYVSVHAGEVLPVEDASPFEFEITATPDEVEELQILFDKMFSEDLETFVNAHIPFKSDEIKHDHQEYDETMVDVYKMIYTLGTPETKKHISEMGIINQRDTN